MKLFTTTIAAVTLLAMPADAATLKLDATAQMAEVTDFSLTFDDINDDGIFSDSEYNTGSFSGFKLQATGKIFDIFVAAADIVGVTDAPGYQGMGDWAFNASLAPFINNFSQFNWSYEISEVDTVAPVPLPAGFPLLTAGLLTLGIMRRRKPQS